MRGRDTLRTAGLWALLLLCLAGWVLPQQSIDFRRARFHPQESLLLLPTGRYLDVASLGYRQVLADALYLWSIQYYGYHRTRLGRQYLWRIFDVITDLDPRYQDAYLTGALIMAVDMDDAPLAIRLLDKGSQRNPDDWIYPLESAYYAWMNLGDYELAAQYFDRTLQYPDAPAMVPRLRAAMDERLGNKASALALWMQVYDDAEHHHDERIMAIAWQHVYDLKVQIDLEALRQAIERFRAARGRPPRVLQALATQGYLQQVPRTPDGDEYAYDPVTGEVTDPRGSGSRARR